MREKLRTYLEMIRFPHTVFALPFAFMGAILPAGGIPPGDKLLWILVAMVGARSGAMGMNRPGIPQALHGHLTPQGLLLSARRRREAAP